MPIYRPRMAAKLLVPTDLGRAGEGSGLEFPIRPRSATLTVNDHNHADELELECQWSDLGLDPRWARSASVEFHMGEADERGDFAPDSKAGSKTLRFMGIADKIERKADDGGGQIARMTFRDFTALFLAMKPFPTKGLPSFADNLKSAWERICDHVGYRTEDGGIISNVSQLRGRLEFRGGVDAERPLGESVASRFRRLATVPAKDKSDAWAIWQQCVGMLGLVSYIDRDRCVVTTSTDLFASNPEEAPKLVWGSNILEMSETAIAPRDSKGIGLSSYDPLTGKTIEATYAPPSEVKVPRVRANRKHATGTIAEPTEDLEWFEYHGVTDPSRLEEIAKRVFLERSQQELEGTLMTSEMRVGRAGNARASIDLLTLRAGDSIRVEIDPLDVSGVLSIAGVDDRTRYLIDRGYNPSAAAILARNAKRLMEFGRTFKVRSARIHLAADGDAGEFSVHVEYMNQIRLEPEAR